MVEANAELGSFCCTHETWPQVLDSPHVGVSFAGNSPVIEDLELERYGFRFAASPVVLATTYRDGTNCLICQDPARTAENFARHSGAGWPADAGDPVPGPRDDGGIQRAELVLAAPGPFPAAARVRAVRLRHGLPGRADDGDDRARAVRAYFFLGCVPADPDDAGGVLGAWRAVRPGAGGVRHHVRAVLHHGCRHRRQRGPGRRADPVLPRPWRGAVDVGGGVVARSSPGAAWLGYGCRRARCIRAGRCARGGR